jgi:ribosomal protein S16
MIAIEELVSKTVFELKSYAKKNNINLDGATTKMEILETIGSFIPDPKKEKAKENTNNQEKVAIYSTKNLHWLKVGQLMPGYNIVTKEASEKWLTRKQVRLATPEELASYYGK